MALRKLLLILSIFIIGDCFGQSPMFKLIAKKSGGCSYLLDQYSGAAAAYSLRQLRCAYTGPLIRVRRSSDNTESDIYPTANGDLDTSALKTFVGTGGSDDGFVITWYDQSGNANNATQSTAANQPYIIDNGIISRENTKPVIKFDGSNDYMVLSSGISGANPYSSFYVQKKNATGSIGFWFSNTSTSPYTPVLYNNGALYISNNTGNYKFNISYTINTYHLMSGFCTATNSFEVYVNGSSISLPSSLSEGASTNFTQIGRRGAGEASGVSVAEAILYTSNETSNRTGIETNINTYYSAY